MQRPYLNRKYPIGVLKYAIETAHLESVNLNCFKNFLPIISTLSKNTECQEERFGLKRVNWPEETLYPKSNALIQFAARRAPVRGEKYSA